MSTFNELIDFTRSTTGTYLDSVVYGDESLTGSWTTVTGFDNITSGTGTNVTTTSTSSGASRCYLQINNVEQGKQYKLTVTVSQSNVSSLSVYLRDGASPNSGTLVSGQSGMQQGNTYTLMGVAESNLMGVLFIGTAASFTANVSVKEIIGGQVSGTPLLRTAAINEPRLEYDASGNPLGLLIEEARTNVLAYSKDFTAGWSGYVISSTTNAIATPDGAVSGAKLQEDSSGTGGPRFYPNDNAVLTANQAQTFSCFFKAGTSNYAYVTIRHTNQNIAGAEFDLANGTVNSTQDSGNMTVNGSDIRSVGNGWYRCSVTATCSVSTNSGLYLLGLTDGTGILNGGYPFYTLTGKNIYAWGAQVEIGEFPTSYIPTSGSTVTRASDIASLPVERFAFNDTKGSVVVSASSFANLSGSNNGYVAVLSDGTSNNRMQVVLRDSSQGFITGGLGLLDAGSVAQSQTTKIAMAVKTNDAGLSLNGGAVVTATSGNIPSPITDLRLGGRTALDSATLCGHIKSMQYYPKRLSNEELQLLTQPSASPTMNLTFDGQATSTLVEGLHD